MSTTTKPRTAPKAALPKGNGKNQPWSLTNEKEIKSHISPFEFTGLTGVLEKLFLGGIKLAPLYKSVTVGKTKQLNWSLTNEREIKNKLFTDEFTGLQMVLDGLLMDGIQMKIVYKNVPGSKAKA